MLEGCPWALVIWDVKAKQKGHRGFFFRSRFQSRFRTSMAANSTPRPSPKEPEGMRKERPNTIKIYFCLLNRTKLFTWSRRDKTDWVLKPNSNSLAGESKCESSPHLGKGIHPGAQDTDMITERVLFYSEKITGKDWHIKHWRLLFLRDPSASSRSWRPQSWLRGSMWNHRLDRHHMPALCLWSTSASGALSFLPCKMEGIIVPA